MLFSETYITRGMKPLVEEMRQTQREKLFHFFLSNAKSKNENTCK